MKQCGLILFLIMLYAVSMAQFKKNLIEIKPSFGCGVYGSSSNDLNDTTKGIKAACGLLNLSIDYSPVKRLVFGLNFERNGFLTPQDSTVSHDLSARTLNYRLKIMFKIISGDHNALYLHGLSGLTYLKFDDKNSDYLLKSNGFNYELGLGFQHLFGRRFGFFIESAYAGYNFNELRNEDNDIAKTGLGNPLEVLFSGLNTRFGISISLN